MFTKKSSALTIGAVAVLVAVGTTGGAVAASLITGSQIAPHTITTHNLGTNSVYSYNITPNAVGSSDLVPSINREISNGVDTGRLVTDATGSATIANIGGPFATNHTDVQTMHLNAGTYLVSSYGFFANPSQATPTQGETTYPTLELAVRGQDGSEWGADYGTCFASPAINQYTETTCQSTRVITVPAGGMDVKVQLFGYNANRSSSMSGDYTGTVDVSALQIK